VRDIVETSPRTYAWSALLLDKRILLNRKRNAFIMYGIEGRSWVALGDPIGPEEEKAELAWHCELKAGCTLHGDIAAPRLLIDEDATFCGNAAVGTGKLRPLALTFT
jgi:lysylphosphatidylglycerol synthetase-like protein (DUF2156 family)